MKRIGLVVHAGRQDALAYAAQAAAYLTAQGVRVLAEADIADKLGAGALSFSQGAEVPEAILSLGGDGTLLRGAQYALRCDAALMGINLGRVGFLSEAEPDDLTEVLSRLLSDRYEVETRSVLEIQKVDGESWLGLNDVVISRGGYARLITIDALVDGEEAGRYVADGLIVATPTGSTGYSLSAGGPIVSPDVDCMMITPICAHSLQHRPCVVPGGAQILLRLDSGVEQQATLQVDGQNRALLTGAAQVLIRRAAKPIRLIRLKDLHFFQLVRDKLTEWSR